MTPYAVLLVRAVDSDELIRKRFHVLARTQHPDRDGAAGHPGLDWFRISRAYSLIRTTGLRATWAREQKMLSGWCTACQGTGVTGSRVGGCKVRLCASCGGEGRTKK